MNLFNKIKTYKKNNVRSGNEGNLNTELAIGYTNFFKFDFFWRNYLSFKWIKPVFGHKAYYFMQNFGLESSIFLASLKNLGK